MIAGSTRLINQILNAAACMPNKLPLYHLNISTVAVALNGNSVKPMEGAIAITK